MLLGQLIESGQELTPSEGGVRLTLQLGIAADHKEGAHMHRGALTGVFWSRIPTGKRWSPTRISDPMMTACRTAVDAGEAVGAPLHVLVSAAQAARITAEPTATVIRQGFVRPNRARRPHT